MQWARRFTQAVCLLGFLTAVLIAAFYETEDPPAFLRVLMNIDPLVVVGTFLASHHLGHGFILGLIVLLSALVLGRAFCGWICPLGAVHAFMSWLRPRPQAPQPRQRRSPWQRGKYVALLALLAAALFGAHWVGIFSPLPLLYRSVAAAALPAVHYGAQEGANAVYHADPHLGPLHLTSVTEPVYQFLRNRVLRVDRQAFVGSLLIATLFIAIVLLNWVRPRFWCRYICPAGGLLGLLSQRPMMRLKNDPDTCNDCGKCNQVCPAAAQPDLRGEWLPTECFACWNCVAACNFKSLSFEFESPVRPADAGALDLSKRAALAAAAGGVVGLLASRLTPEAQAKTFEPTLIRPPGAEPEPQFLQRCIQCGLCMRACPTNALHPAGLEAGIEGLWTPKMVAKVGYCEYNCNVCGQVCPTGAIADLPLAEKQEVRIGIASFDTTRCLPYAYGQPCIVCEEHCPLPVKAIYLVNVDVPQPDGTTRTLQQPRINPDLCIGCGICEWSCPWGDQAAVRITSANESRHPANQPILPSFGAPYAIPPAQTGADPYGSTGASDPYGASGDPYGSP